MSGEEIERLIRTAPPGTRFEIVRITIPESQSLPVVMESQPPSEGWTPEAVVAWVAGTYGPEGIKLKEWARMPIGVSGRELERARRDGRLACHEKACGRDHRAVMASPEAMESFLSALAATGHENGQHNPA